MAAPLDAYTLRVAGPDALPPVLAQAGANGATVNARVLAPREGLVMVASSTGEALGVVPLQDRPQRISDRQRMHAESVEVHGRAA
jgi:hypothetical protein